MQKQLYRIKDVLMLDNVYGLKKRAKEHAENGYLYFEVYEANYCAKSLFEPLGFSEQTIKDGPSTFEYTEDLLPSSD
ncbi:hypothetical protein A0J61_02591 [Choanephora cucurbitarum]|uniref:Uncharacterized protein n=1 Tax=Choanephora cucurbitarum TaxID=101091 RepID=A0A1C7NK45_9FUNG|nr:hypothetical protein A0J61_02591 [Choanephora cucurbitarum]